MNTSYDTAPEITGDDVSPGDQAVRYELATLSFRLPDTEKAIAGIRPWVESADGAGSLLGAWRSEHGVLGRAHVLRAFVDTAEVAVERDRARRSGRAFGARPHLTDLSMTTYAPFPFMPAVRPGHYGAVYETRDYHLTPGGLPPSIDVASGVARPPQSRPHRRGDVRGRRSRSDHPDLAVRFHG
ncbi:hypothetical protein [Rhodococcoides fascians]|uniref:hypothetical protein n=1 Tax=Rhodococcoides fascians TaxID=1828 RepID=UPI000A7EC94E|nr:hypothetical protein [Rhodococcus fascians]